MYIQHPIIFSGETFEADRDLFRKMPRPAILKNVKARSRARSFLENSRPKFSNFPRFIPRPGQALDQQKKEEIS
jgi:hypothetical protein